MSHTTQVKSIPIKSVSALYRMAQILKDMGLNVELKAKSVPRFFYKDQIERTLKRTGAKMKYHFNCEECDFVLHLKDSYFDVGFLYDENGDLVPLFDDFEYKDSSGYLGKSVRSILGADSRYPTTDRTSKYLGKMQQAYSAAVALESAENAGYVVSSSEFNEKGEMIIELQVL